MYNDVITLVKETFQVDSYGDEHAAESHRNVFAEVKSAGMKETYEALAVGLKPEFKFVIADYYDYDDEEVVIYKEQKYRVLRTFRGSNSLELVVTKHYGNA